MGLFGRKKDNEEMPENFVLFNEEEEYEEFEDYEDSYNKANNIQQAVENDIIAEDEEYEEYDDYEDSYNKANEFQDTTKIDISEVEELMYDDEDGEEVEIERGFFGNLIHNRVFLVIAGCLLAAIILAVATMGVVNYLNPLRNYAQVLASKENVLRTMDVEGTLESGNKYNITSLVAGKIITSKYEVGDTIKAGDVLYKIDDTDAKLALERAKNDLEKANDPKTGVKLEGNVRIVATEAGVIKTLNIKPGSTVTAGSQIGTVLKSDETVAPLISYVSGKVSIVNVNVGRSIVIGQVIASMASENEGSSEADKKYDKKAGEIDVQAAQRYLENYTIKAPVGGVVAEKYCRVGDNIGITDSNNPMMVIIDTSTLTFKFKVDEYKAREMKKGLEVVVSTDSLPEETFMGKVSYVSTEGVQDENGKPMFEVGVTIEEPGDLKAGMNVKAKVVLASAKKVVAVPEKALLKSDGQNALILIKDNEFAENVDDIINESFENQAQHPDIKVPKGCSLITVRYGISDGAITEVKSGVEVGDTIVYDPEADNEFVVATGKEKEKDNKSVEESDVGRGLSGQEEDGKTSREKANERVQEKMKSAIGGNIDNDDDGITDYAVEQ